MPWKETTKMQERMKFIIRLEDGEKMTDLCSEFSISRKTGYKLYNRYKIMSHLNDLKRGPKRAANLTSKYIQDLITKKKEANMTWGAPKIKHWLMKKYPNEPIPVKSTVHAILERNGLVKKRRRKNPKYFTTPTYLSKPSNPNDLWCVDFKGQFKMLNRQYCYPLTVSDQLSRYLLSCEGIEAIKAEEVKIIFEEIFQEYGLPDAIRSDNGEPFSSRTIWGLSTLSVWWLRLGIKLERIKPGHPEQNGIHERMHRTLKWDTTKPPANNLLQQQDKFEKFKIEFNNERPHEGLEMKTPSEIYVKSNKKYSNSLNPIDYSDCDDVKKVTNCGSIYIEKKKKIFISSAFRGQILGLIELDEDIWQVYFMDYTLGFFDKDSNRLSVADSPFINFNNKSVT